MIRFIYLYVIKETEDRSDKGMRCYKEITSMYMNNFEDLNFILFFLIDPERYSNLKLLIIINKEMLSLTEKKSD